MSKAIDEYELKVVAREGSVIRVLREVLVSLATGVPSGTLAAYNIHVRDRRSQKVLGLVEAGDDPGTASALLDLLVERAHELTPSEFLAWYHLGEEP